MASFFTLTVEGISGGRYSMRARPTFMLGEQSVPGVYLYGALEIGRFRPIYVGETDDLRDRLQVRQTQHHRWRDIQRAGATHVASLVVHGPRAHRLSIETDIRHRHPGLINHQAIPARKSGFRR